MGSLERSSGFTNIQEKIQSMVRILVGWNGMYRRVVKKPPNLQLPNDLNPSYYSFLKSI